MSLLDELRSRDWAAWALLAAGVVVLAGLGWGGWAMWKTRYEAQGALALAQARSLAMQSQAQGAPAEAAQRAEKSLQEVIADYPRLSSVGQAAFLLGSLRYAGGRYAEARQSFELARTKAGSPSLAALAGLDIGYAWEAEKNYEAAEKAFQSVVSASKPKDFLYEEALIDVGRSQELGGKPAAAVETYQRLLKDLPDSRRADELKSRLARLQAPAKP